MSRKLQLIWLGLLALILGFGCGSIQVSAPPTEDATRQRGKAVVPAGEELDVYYPVPFNSPPNLLVQSTFNDCSIIEQKPDHFRVKNNNPFSREVTWDARGVPVSTPAPVQIGVTVPVQ